MEDEVFEKYKLAGSIAAKAREFGKELIKSGVSYLDIVNKIESKILNDGAGLAFPVNISINEIAAHFSPKHNDSLIFQKGDVVKLDIGAHIDGYIADTALTIEVESNLNNDLIKASTDALDVAINLMKPGIDLTELGAEVQKTITSFGFKPIDNLTGHSMQRYILHAGVSVPSVGNTASKSDLKAGDVLAIEPFATTGAGHVISGVGSNIYLCKKSINLKLIRDSRSKILFDKVKKEFKTLPFAQRWFERQFSNSDTVLRKLSFLGLLKHYPQLIDAKKGVVSQAEHTVILTEEGCEIIT
jgi:methionyl aminopeptidase